jgi:hypothetical protein
MLPYQHAVSNNVSRLLSEYSIKTVHISVKISIHMLGSLKDKLSLEVAIILRSMWMQQGVSWGDGQKH